MRTATDVLVVGGGPVGLLLASELQRRGIDHLLIEQKAEPTYFCKALTPTRRQADYRLFAEISDRLRARHSKTTVYGIVAPDPRPLDLDRYPLFSDSNGRFRAAYGISGTAPYLIRPDGFIGYRAAPPRLPLLDAHLARILKA